MMALKFNVILVWKKHYMQHNTREFAKIDDLCLMLFWFWKKIIYVT